MATKQVEEQRPMPATPEELAQAIFRDADRKLASRRRQEVPHHGQKRPDD